MHLRDDGPMRQTSLRQRWQRLFLSIVLALSSWRARGRAARARHRAPRNDVFYGYSKPNFAQRHRRKLLFLFGFTLLIYSMLFTLIGRFLLLQFLIPLIVLALLVIWILPEMARVPTRLLERLSITFLFALLCWPDYLALGLPGLPWVTAIRIVGVPMMLAMLICVSGSAQFRADMRGTLAAIPLIWQGMVLFSLLALASIAVSAEVGVSINKFVVAMLSWTLVFFCAVFVFRRNGRAEQFGYALWGICLLLCLFGFQEWRHSVVPWAGHIPSFLKIEDENVQKIMAGSARAASGVYRVQSKFTTPLSFAEFLAMTTPFVLHFMLRSKRLIVIIAAVLTLGMIFWTIRTTDSRLGVIGFFMSILFTVLAWGGMRWARDRDSIFGPATVLAFPVGGAVFFAATLYISRLRAIVWGNGVQQFSDNARQVQVEMAMPMIFSAPWGHGIGRGAATLGYANLAGTLTIDSYYLSVALEFGVIGFVVYYGMVIVGIAFAARYALVRVDRDTAMLVPLAIALTNFLVIKSVLSQQETHPLMFAMLGAVVALVWRVKLSCPPVPRLGVAISHHVTS